MNFYKNINKEQGLWICVTILVFLYVLVRAIYNPLSHDEVATYFHYIQSGEYLPPQSGIIWDANNHLLNSFLTEISYYLFGNSPFALRLPNVLSFLIYASSVGALLHYLKNKWVRTFGFIALLSVGYLVEYFALCRGYGLSMAFFTCSLTYLLKYIITQKNKHLIVLFGILFLACLANLTLINTYGLTLVLLLFIFLMNYKAYTSKKRIAFFFILISSLVLMLYPIYFSLQLKAKGALYYGSKTGLWDVTGKTLTQQVFGSTHFLFGLFYVLLISGALFLFFREKAPLQLKLKSPLFLIIYFIVGNIFAIYFLVYFLAVNFPEDRAAFYFIPLFLLLTLFVLDRLEKLNYISFVFLFFPVYFLTQLNIQGSIFSADERVSQVLHKKVMQDNLKQPTVGAYQTHILCYNYLEQRTGRKTNFAQPYKENDTLQDYLVNKHALIDTNKVFPLYKLVYHEKETDVVLLKRKRRVDFKETQTKHFPDTTFQWEYLNLIEDTLNNQRAIKLNIQTEIKTASNYFKGNLVFSGRDSLNNEIEYQYINLDWLFGTVSNQRLINQNIVVNTNQIHHYILYLWNIDNVKFNLENTKIQRSEMAVSK